MISFSEQMQRWARIVDRPLNKFEQMTIARPFKYDAYWRCWSRVIKPVYDGYPHGCIEMNLTPILNASQSWEKDILPMIMRCHSTPAGKKDIFKDSLPKPEYDALVANVGYENAMFMIECDIWPMMDLEKFVVVKTERYVGKAGVPFSEFRLLGTEGMAA